MKKFIMLCFAFTLLVSCGSKKQAAATIPDNSIVYILPTTVTNALKAKLGGNYKDIYFSLVQDNGNYTLYYDYKTYGSKVNAWVDVSKRKLLIDKTLYPLIFDTDETFGVADSYKNIIDGANNGGLQFLQRISISRGNNKIRFKPDGTLLN